MLFFWGVVYQEVSWVCFTIKPLAKTLHIKKQEPKTILFNIYPLIHTQVIITHQF